MSYVDRSEAAMRAIRERLGGVPLAMAQASKGEVLETMRRSTPQGRRYPNPAGPGFVTAARRGQPPAIHTREYERSYGTAGPVREGSRDVAAVTSDMIVGTRQRRPLWHILEFGWKNGGPFPHVRPGMERGAAEIRRAVEAR